MHVQKKIPSTLVVLIYLASAAVLVMSPACAADSAQSTTVGQGTAGYGTGHHGAFNATFNATMQAEHLQSIITKLGQQGVDITQVQADLTAGNTDAVNAWFQAYYKDHPMTFANRTGMKPAMNASMQRPAMNATMQAEHLQSMITNLGQQGTDVSQVQADLAAGNTTAVWEWFKNHYKDHPMTSGNRTGMKPMMNASMQRPAMNATMQAEHLQSMITNLGQQGVDVSQVQADLAAGNTTAVREWLQQYRKDHPGIAVNASVTRSGTGTSGDVPWRFPGQRVNTGNRTTATDTTGDSGTSS